MTGNWIARGQDAARLQGQLATLIQQLTNASAVALSLKNVMAQMTVATDYTTIEAQFGLSPGQGGTLHDVLGSASDVLQAATIQALLQRFA